MSFETSGPEADSDLSDSIQVEPPLQIPCGLILRKEDESHKDGEVKPVETILDTSLPTSTITLEAVQELGLAPLVVVDDSQHGPYIPINKLWLRMGSIEATVPSPAILVTNEVSGQFGLRLGMDFMRNNGAVVDLREEELNILVEGSESAMVPFIRPRPSLSFGDDL